MKFNFKLIGLFIIILIVSKNTMLAYDWPINNTNSQHQINGTFGECREARDHFHSGVDIQGTSGTAVYAIERGTAYISGIGINIGHYRYYHLTDFEVNDEEIVDPGDLIGYTNADNHVHFIESNNLITVDGMPANNTLLNPLFGLDPFNDNDVPVIDEIIVYRQGTSEVIASNILYGQVDYSVEARDPGVSSTGGATTNLCGIHDIIIEIRDRDNIIGNRINYTTFDELPTQAAINYTYAEGSNSSRFIYWATNDPFNAPYNKYWNTRQKTGSDYSISADCNNEAMYKDGEYTIRTIVYDVQDNIDIEDQTRIIDNFLPYVERVVVREGNENGDLVYDGNWSWNGSQLTFPTPTSNTLEQGETAWIKVYTSEPMQNVELNAFGTTNNGTQDDDDGKEWYFTRSGVTEGTHTLTVTRNSVDLAGNQLNGFTVANSENSIQSSAIPKHQSDGSWNPAASNVDDVVHIVEVESGKLAAPINVQVSTEYNDRIEITWDHPDAEATCYQIFRRIQGSSSFTPLPSGWIDYTGKEYIFIDQAEANLIHGELYYYTIRAAENINGDRASLNSEPVVGSLHSDCTIDFSWEQPSLEVLEVNFTPITTSYIESYYWDFGDDEFSNDSKPKHTYKESDSYIVTLYTQNTDGVECETVIHELSVISVSGVSDFEVEYDLNPIFGTTEEVYTIKAFVTSSDVTAPFNYKIHTGEKLFVFDEEYWTDVKTPEFTYSTSGKKKIVISVTDVNGKHGFKEGEVTIDDPSNPGTCLKFTEYGIGFSGCNVVPKGTTVQFIDKASPASEFDKAKWTFDFGNEDCVLGTECAIDYSGYRPTVEYKYTESGVKEVWLMEWNQCKMYEDWARVYVVNCDGIARINNSSNIINRKTANKHYLYAGTFDLHYLLEPSSLNYVYEACNEISLKTGAHFKATNTSSLILSVDNPCLSGGNDKSYKINNEELDTKSPVAMADGISSSLGLHVVVYPNPTNGNFNIEFTGGVEHINVIDIYNLTGQRIETIAHGIAPINEINTSNWQNGMYIIRITTNNGYVVKKLVKE